MVSSNFPIQFVLLVTDGLFQCLTHFMVPLQNVTEINEHGVYKDCAKQSSFRKGKWV